MGFIPGFRREIITPRITPLPLTAAAPTDIAVLGHWSYAFCVSLYGILLIDLMGYFRVTFQALMFFFIRSLESIVVRNRSLVPFSRL